MMLAVGIALGWGLRDGVCALAWFFAATIALLLLFLVWLKRHCFSSAQPVVSAILSDMRHGHACLALLALCFLLTGAGLSALHFEKIAVAWPRETRVWTAVVRSVNKITDRGTQVDISMLDPGFRGKTVRAFFEQNGSRLSAGQHVSLHAAIREPENAGNPGEFDQRSFLLTHGISGTCWTASGQWVLLPTDGAGTLAETMLQARERLIARYEARLSADALPIIAALTLGDKTILDRETKELFSETGTSHILALSGLHLGILFSIFNLVLLRHCRRRFPRVIAALLGMGLVWLFVMLCGQSASLVRSATMLTLLNALTCVQRRSSTLNNLTLTGIVMLVASPLTLFDVGFELSFLSVLSIILFNDFVWRHVPLPAPYGNYYEIPHESECASHRLYRLRVFRFKLKFAVHRAIRRLFGFIAVSLSAQIGTVALVAYYFHTVSPLAFLANFIVIPCATLLIGGAVAFFVFPFAQGALATAGNTIVRFMTDGLVAVSKLPLSHVDIHANICTLLAATLATLCLIGFCIRHRSWKIYAFTLFVALGAASECITSRTERIRPQIIVYNVRKASAVHFITSAKSSYVFSTSPADSTFGALAYIEQNFWSNNAMTHPRFVAQGFEDRQITVRRDAIVFGGKSVAIVGREFQFRKVQRPLAIDVLIIGRGFRRHIADLRKIYAPRTIVLDASLSRNFSERLKEECREAKIPCHAVSESGAFVLPL